MVPPEDEAKERHRVPQSPRRYPPNLSLWATAVLATAPIHSQLGEERQPRAVLSVPSAAPRRTTPATVASPIPKKDRSVHFSNPRSWLCLSDYSHPQFLQSAVRYPSKGPGVPVQYPGYFAIAQAIQVMKQEHRSFIAVQVVHRPVHPNQVLIGHDLGQRVGRCP